MVTVAGDSPARSNTAGIYVRLKDLGERERDQFAIMDEVAARSCRRWHNGVRAALQAPGIAGGGGGGGGQARATSCS